MKRIYMAAFLLFPVLMLILGSPVPAHSQLTLPPECVQDSLPSGDPKNPQDHQLIVICIPANWNGRVILYAGGYHLPQLPLELPIDELTLDNTFVPAPLLLGGFAFATTSFRKNGVAIEQGAEDLNQLLEHFKSVAPQPPEKVYITGASEGGLIAVLLLERYAKKYDAGLALCAPLAGSPELIRDIYDFRVVFDYFFPSVFTFGAVDVPNDAFLLWQTPDPNDNDYVKLITQALTNDPVATDQLFRVTNAPVDPDDRLSAITTALSLLSYNIFGLEDLIATAKGVPVDNRHTKYTGSLDDLALNAEVERIKGDGRARAYARRFYTPTGNLRRPLVTLHNTLDPVVPFAHEEFYEDLVDQKNKSAFLTVLPVPRYGHCNFTTDEVLQAFTTMVQQAETQLVN